MQPSSESRLRCHSGATWEASKEECGASHSWDVPCLKWVRGTLGHIAGSGYTDGIAVAECEAAAAAGVPCRRQEQWWGEWGSSWPTRGTPVARPTLTLRATLGRATLRSGQSTRANATRCCSYCCYGWCLYWQPCR